MTRQRDAYLFKGVPLYGGQSLGTVPDPNWQIILVGDFGL
jgi:hypothetical protein